MTVTVILLSPLLGVKLDERVDTHDGDACLDGRLQLLDLAHAGLEHSLLDLVDELAAGEVQTVVLVVLLLGCVLLGRGRGVGVVGGALCHRVPAAQLGDELAAVLGRVDGKSGRDDEEGLSEGADGKLLAGALILR